MEEIINSICHFGPSRFTREGDPGLDERIFVIARPWTARLQTSLGKTGRGVSADHEGAGHGSLGVGNPTAITIESSSQFAKMGIDDWVTFPPLLIRPGFLAQVQCGRSDL